MANWRSDKEAVHFFSPKWDIFGILALQNKERLSRGLDVKWHIPPIFLMPPESAFLLGFMA